MLATIKLHPVLMMTKKRWTTKIFAGIIRVCPNATTPEQHILSGHQKCTNNEILLEFHKHFAMQNVTLTSKLLECVQQEA